MVESFKKQGVEKRNEIEPTFKKSKQEQERKRQLWNEQQQARLKNNLPEKRDLAGGQDRPGAESSQEKLDEEITQGPQARNPRAIAARMREFQKREAATQAEKKLKGQIQSSAGVESTSQHLKTVYRVINGTSAITIIGLVITISIMNAQLIFGNLLKLKKFPKLSLIEIIVISFLDLLFLFITLVLFVFIYAMLHPCEVSKSMSEWGAVADLMGAICGIVGKVVGAIKSLF